MERVTRVMAKGKFEHWVKALGGRLATSSRDVGGYLLTSNSPGDGITRYQVERVVTAGGGVSIIIFALGARDLWDKLEAGEKTLEQRERPEIALTGGSPDGL